MFTKILRLNPNTIAAVCAGLLIMGLGVYLNIRISAATTIASAEAESGIIVGSASLRGDPAASGGQAVRFTQLPRGMWVWDATVATDTNKRDDLMDFAVSKGVNRLYLESEELILSNQAAITSFCIAAAQHGIEVELLFGNNQWTYSSNHTYALALATKSAHYVGSLQGPKPIAVHFDVEPHTLPDFETDRDGVFAQYLILLQKLQVAKGSQLQFNVDYPLGFDVLSAKVGSETKLMSAWMYDYVDRGIMMDYRDFADTDDGIIARVAFSMEHAKNVGKTVGIGVETLCDLEPEKISFCEEGEAVMLRELAKVQAVYGDSAAFGGFSIHYYDSYSSLIP